MFGVGASYAIGQGTFGVLWTHTQLENSYFASKARPLDARFDNIEVNGNWKLTPALALFGDYTFTFGKTSGSGTTSSTPKWHSVLLGTDYSLSKRTDVYLAGVYQHSSSESVNGVSFAFPTSIGGIIPSSTTQNQVAVTTGIRHRF